MICRWIDHGATHTVETSPMIQLFLDLSLSPIMRSTKQEKKENTQSGVLPPSPPLSAPPPPPHLVRRVHGRPRRQKRLHHRRATAHSSEMQRRPSILRRTAALRQAPPLSVAQVRAPPSAPRDPLYHTPRGATAGKKTEGLVQTNDGVTKSYVSGPEKVPIFFQHACGPHPSSEASLRAALRFKLDGFDSKRQSLPGSCPFVATRWKANMDSLF